MKKPELINMLEIIMVFVFMGVLVLILLPLIRISYFTYPSCDDFNFGHLTHQALLSGANAIDVIRAAAETSASHYLVWQGSYVAIFLMALQPGIFGEQYYFITTYIMLGALCISEIVCLRYFIVRVLGARKRYAYIIGFMILIVQILFVPDPGQTFFWFNGAIYYTFIYAIAILFVTLLSKIVIEEMTTKTTILLCILAGVLAVIVGGSNLATGLMMFVILTLFLVAVLWKKRTKIKVFFPIYGVYLIAFLINVLAPGQLNRQNSVGEHSGAIESIWLAVKNAGVYIFEWNHLYTIAILLFMVPMCWKVVRSSKFSFVMPGIFSLVTFLVFASQITPIMYAGGTRGPGRMADIAYYSYWLLLFMNELYLVGWISRRTRVVSVLEKITAEKYTIAWYFVFGVAMCISLMMGIKGSSSYLAYRSLNNGQTEEYRRVMEQRL